MNKRQIDRCKYYFEELEKYFKEKIEEELESISTNIEEYRRIEGLTYAIESSNNNVREFMKLRGFARSGINEIERELLKDVENSY